MSDESMTPVRPSALRRIAATAVCGLALALFVGTVNAPGAAAASGADSYTFPVDSSANHTVPTPPAISNDQASTEASAVVAEDRRLIQIRAVAGTAKTGGTEWKSPFRLATGSGYTLVLTPRTAPYTVDDLLALAPSTFLLQSDGSYLLLENIYVERGATLQLNRPGGLKLRMASNANGFVSIVTFGGDLVMTGTPDARMTITSWDPRTAQPETDPTHGRAYIRAIGGTFTMSYVDVIDLGFWSGRTGGIGLTGTTRPATGSTSGPTTYTGAHGKAAQKVQKLQKATAPATSPDSSTLGSNGVTSQPAGPLGTPDSQFNVPGLSYVSTQIDHDTITGNAFGLFLSGATGIVISDTQVTGSLIAGVVLHRFATQAVIQHVDASHNDGDGFIISRAAQQVQITNSTAYYNAGNGFTVNGQPISVGPSASGEPMGAYGNNTIGTSTSHGNGHYGIEVLGGLNIGLNDNTIVGNLMGIVIRKGAQKVTISGNKLTQQDREGISIRDGVQAVTVNDNIIDGAATGVYVRNATADIAGNTIRGASIHGVTLVGSDAGSLVNGNTISGIGPGAIDTNRETGKVDTSGNQTAGWFNTTTLWIRIKALIRPLTIVWMCLFALILFFTIKGHRTRTGKGKRHERRRAKVALGAHPYADQATLTSTLALERQSNGLMSAVVRPAGQAGVPLKESAPTAKPKESLPVRETVPAARRHAASEPDADGYSARNGGGTDGSGSKNGADPDSKPEKAPWTASSPTDETVQFTVRQW
jgi:parallel beta helix pectate lyase-like protein